MRYVVAGDYRQYGHYCQENHLNPNRDATYVQDAFRLQGTLNPQVVFYGTWSWRRDLRQIQSVLSMRGATITYA